MSRLDNEEKKLANWQQLETMRQELASKRQRVLDLKGTKDSKSKSVNKQSKTKKTSDTAAATTKLSKKSKSKADGKIDKDSTIRNLRSDEHFQTLVHKELKKMGPS